MIIILAPVVILGIALIACMVLFPKEYTFFFSILLILNFAGSGGDYFQWLKINKYPANTFFQDNSVETLVYQREIDEDMR